MADTLRSFLIMVLEKRINTEIYATVYAEPIWRMSAKLALLLIAIQLSYIAAGDESPSLFASPGDLGKCVASCSEFPIKIGKKLYHIESKEKQNWFGAAESCRKWGGHLLNIESSGEMDLITGIVTASPFWISLNCLARDGDFISIATGVAMPYVKWQVGQPDNQAGNENCVEATAAGLSDANCETALNYVCQANIL